MLSRSPLHGLLLTGVLGLALVSPASALSKSGASLLESLRSKVDTKPNQAPVPESPSKPVVIFQEPAAAPEKGYEPGAVVPEPVDSAEEPGKPAPEAKPAQSATKADDKQPKTDMSKPEPARSDGPGSLLGKPPAVQADPAVQTAAPNMQDVLEKLEALRKRLEKGSSKSRTPKNPADEKVKTGTLTLKEPPQMPKAPAPSAPATLEAPSETTDAPIVQETRPADGSARQFGELTDAELIQYAHEHVWSSEKSRKHNPPVTPPTTKAKKKKKDAKEDKTPVKASPKKPAVTGKAATGSAKAPASPKKANTGSAKAPSVVVQKAVR